MNTQTLQRRPQIQPENLPPQCLLDPSPSAVDVVDAEDRAVKLGCAGFALRPSGSYRLRMTLPHPRESIDKVRIVNSPDFIHVEEGRCESSVGGISEWIVPFKTKGIAGFGIRSLFLGVPTGDVELLVYPRDPAIAAPPAVRVPVIVWRRLVAIGWAFLALLLATAVEKVFVASVIGDQSIRKGFTELGEALRRFDGRTIGLAVGVLAGGFLIATAAIMYQAYRRARELHARFVEDYPRRKPTT